MSNIPAPAVATRLGVALLVLVAPACSDRGDSTRDPRARAARGEERSERRTNNGRIFFASGRPVTMSCTRSIPMARTFAV